MVRAITQGPGDHQTHVENRVGEPAANPYLYMASQIHAGLDGIKSEIDPGAPTDTPYEADAPLLPSSLMDATRALSDSALYREAMGSPFIDYILRLKEAEIARFMAEVTEWEHREYFDVF